MMQHAIASRHNIALKTYAGMAQLAILLTTASVRCVQMLSSVKLATNTTLLLASVSLLDLAQKTYAGTVLHAIH